MAGSGTYTLLDQVTTNATSEALNCIGCTSKTVQATVTGSGAVSATVTVQVSNNPTVLGWIAITSLSLSGTDSHTLGGNVSEHWAYFRLVVSSISGTSATISAVFCLDRD